MLCSIIKDPLATQGMLLTIASDKIIYLKQKTAQIYTFICSNQQLETVAKDGPNILYTVGGTEAPNININYINMCSIYII